MNFRHRILAATVVIALAAPLFQLLCRNVEAHPAKHGRSQAQSSQKSHAAQKAAAKHAHALAMKQHEERLHAQHLAKLRHQEAAETHDRRNKLSDKQRAHEARLAAKQKHEERLQALAEKLHHSKAYREHLQRQAAIDRAHEAHIARLQAKEKRAHNLALSEHARIARLTAVAAQKERQAARQANLAAQTGRHNARLSRLAAAHNARLAAHNARLAAHEARVDQLNAWHRERQAQIGLAAASGVVQFGTYAQDVPVQVIMVDLNKPNIRVTALLARDGIGSSEPFRRMIERSHPAVAVTGTFFSLDNLKPVGDIVINGTLAYFGGMGTALAITPGNHADMITVEWGRHHDWSGYNTVVACGPRLLKDGVVTLDPRAERFKDEHMLAPNSRIAVGITGNNKLIFAMTRDRIYLGRLAKVMKSLGCMQAMNLDAGASTGFYCNGEMFASPGRWLTNAIVVHTNGQPVTSASQNPTRRDLDSRAAQGG